MTTAAMPPRSTNLDPRPHSLRVGVACGGGGGVPAVTGVSVGPGVDGGGGGPLSSGGMLPPVVATCAATSVMPGGRGELTLPSQPTVAVPPAARSPSATATVVSPAPLPALTTPWLVVTDPATSVVFASSDAFSRSAVSVLAVGLGTVSV